MRALVSGAAGFIGSHLADALLARGDEVVAIDSFTPYYDIAAKVGNVASCRADPRCTFAQADLRTDDLRGLLDGVDVVFHQAAQAGVRESWDHRFGDYASHNVLGTQRLLDAAHRAGVGRFVYASSSSIYGNALRHPTPEDIAPAPFSPYGVTKLAAEHLARAYAQNFGLSTISLRYFTVYGPRQRPDMSIHRLIEAALHGTRFPRFGDGTQIREFTYVGDVVRANLLAAVAEITPGDVCNIAGGSEISLRDLIDLVAAEAGRPIEIEKLPAAAGDVTRNSGATERARELLGWQPEVDLRSGIRAQIDWHLSR
jgi:nucleoside-diphosphate-sugar epimerase